MPEPVEGNVRRFDKLSDRKVQQPTANSQKPTANSLSSFFTLNNVYHFVVAFHHIVFASDAFHHSRVFVKVVQNFLLVFDFFFVVFYLVFGLVKFLEISGLEENIVLVDENYYHCKYQCCNDILVFKFL